MDKITLSKDDLYELMARKPDFDGSEGNLYKMGNIFINFIIIHMHIVLLD